MVNTVIDERSKSRYELLVDAVLDDARRRGLAVLPRCPFARRVIAENQDAYLDLVPADAREEFGLPVGPRT
jgi:uncharacterized protein